MTTTFSYTVSCTFTDAAIRDEWVAWLRDEHLADVVAAGALDAEVIVIDADADADAADATANATEAGSAGDRVTALRCEARYHFASRAAFEVYEREHAPRLRAVGLERFPLEHGLVYARSTGAAHRAGS